MEVIRCSMKEHGEQILEIINDAILNTTAIYDYKERSLEQMEGWFAQKKEQSHPVLGLCCSSGKLMGFASYGIFRAWPAYKYTVEHSVYTHPSFRRQGVATHLLKELIQEARRNDIHVMVGGIDASNQKSVVLHQKLGFMLAGKIEQAAFKFEKWLDLLFYTLQLDTPSIPREG